jgi:hypothetical protein
LQTTQDADDPALAEDVRNICITSVDFFLQDEPFCVTTATVPISVHARTRVLCESSA